MTDLSLYSEKWKLPFVDRYGIGFDMLLKIKDGLRSQGYNESFIKQLNYAMDYSRFGRSCNALLLILFKHCDYIINNLKFYMLQEAKIRNMIIQQRKRDFISPITSQNVTIR